jgi:hypothetical protein
MGVGKHTAVLVKAILSVVMISSLLFDPNKTSYTATTFAGHRLCVS